MNVNVQFTYTDNRTVPPTQLLVVEQRNVIIPDITAADAELLAKTGIVAVKCPHVGMQLKVEPVPIKL